MRTPRAIRGCVGSRAFWTRRPWRVRRNNVAANAVPTEIRFPRRPSCRAAGAARAFPPLSAERPAASGRPEAASDRQAPNAAAVAAAASGSRAVCASGRGRRDAACATAPAAVVLDAVLLDAVAPAGAGQGLRLARPASEILDVELRRAVLPRGPAVGGGPDGDPAAC